MANYFFASLLLLLDLLLELGDVLFFLDEQRVSEEVVYSVKVETTDFL